MSAIVTIPDPENGPCEHARVQVEVPKANSYEEDTDGHLHLRTSTWGGEKVAVFKEWDFVVITPDRGPNGRFVKKD